jgi:hypothetical protein
MVGLHLPAFPHSPFPGGSTRGDESFHREAPSRVQGQVEPQENRVNRAKEPRVRAFVGWAMVRDMQEVMAGWS